MKDLGRKSIVFLQLQGTIQIAKSWICKRLDLRPPRTTSSPPSEGRGTNVVEETGTEIQDTMNETSRGNLIRRKYETIKRSISKLTAKIADGYPSTAPSSEGSGTSVSESTGSGINEPANGDSCDDDNRHDDDTPARSYFKLTVEKSSGQKGSDVPSRERFDMRDDMVSRKVHFDAPANHRLHPVRQSTQCGGYDMPYHLEADKKFRKANDKEPYSSEPPHLLPIPTLQWWWHSSRDDAIIYGYAFGDVGYTDGVKISVPLSSSIDQSTLQEGSWILSEGTTVYQLGVPGHRCPEWNEDDEWGMKEDSIINGLLLFISKYKAFGGKNPSSPFNTLLQQAEKALARGLDVSKCHSLGGENSKSKYHQKFKRTMESFELSLRLFLCAATCWCLYVLFDLA